MPYSEDAAHGWWECAGCGTQNAPDVNECLCGEKLEDQPESARPLMTGKQSENLEKLAREGLRPAKDGGPGTG